MSTTGKLSYLCQLLGLAMGAPISRLVSDAAIRESAPPSYRPLHPIGRGRTTHTNTSQRQRANRRSAKRAARVLRRRGGK
jgi:hypothetical protein